jgi:hypothetical protein
VGASAVVLRVAALACGAAFLTAGVVVAGGAFAAVALAFFVLGLLLPWASTPGRETMMTSAMPGTFISVSRVSSWCSTEAVES